MSFLDINSVKDMVNNVEYLRNELFHLIVIKYSGKTFNVDDLNLLHNKIQNNVEIDNSDTLIKFNQNKEIKEENNDTVEKKINVEKKIKLDHSKCKARILKNGEFLQCTRSKLNTSEYKDYCGLHINQLKKNGKLRYCDMDNDCPIKIMQKTRGRPKKINNNNAVINIICDDD